MDTRIPNQVIITANTFFRDFIAQGSVLSHDDNVLHIYLNDIPHELIREAKSIMAYDDMNCVFYSSIKQPYAWHVRIFSIYYRAK